MNDSIALLRFWTEFDSWLVWGATIE